MLMIDVGANRGDATIAGVELGYKVIALEPAPIVFSKLVSNFIYDENVIPIRMAASSKAGEILEFYECVEDGLSTLEKSWLTDPSMPYYGKDFRTIQVNTCTLDGIIDYYGLPDLVKIDVEGAESLVFAGLTYKPKKLCFEWTTETLDQHIEQLERLRDVNGYTEYALQYIEHHLREPTEYRSLKKCKDLKKWIKETSTEWESKSWKKSGLRPTADVGMIWLR